MDDLDLLIALHGDNARQGPGGAAETALAATLSGLADRAGLRIADVGCGTGAAARALAERLDAHVTAVDFLPAFLERLDGAHPRIETLEASMDALPFEAESLDAIWSEGAIYNIGFARGVEAWRGFLKPGGVLAVSELTWLTAERPAELQAHWETAYPEVDVASAKIAVLERLGFSLLGYFPLGARCWLDNYYRPLQARFAPFLEAQGHSDAARAIVAAEEAEIALYERYRDYFSYGYYIARRR